ncbi:MAG: hypothetical protein ACRDPT_06825 [Streptomycetales bacterium]
MTYLDVNGRAVNTAAFGAGDWQVSATEYNEEGNPTRELTPGNRAQALNPTPHTDPHAASQASSADRADLLSTVLTYNGASDLLTETGPAHPAQLAAGELASVRTRTTYTYDQGAPSGGPYHLVTTATTEPVAVDGTPTTAGDTRTTRTGYNPVVPGDASGWDLGAPTTETVVMSGQPDNTRTTRYDTAGRVIETRMPASGGNDAGTTTTTYYTAAPNTTHPTCGNKPHWAGAVCRTAPAAQPSGQPLPVAITTYDKWGNPATVSETAGTTTRTTATTYDAAGRPDTTSVTVDPPADGGTPVPDLSYGYATSTGLPTTVTAGGATITSGYDNLGRVTNYTDADANTTTTTYTIDGQPATINDGKGTYTLSYDGTDAAGREEHRGLLTRLDTGMGATTPDVFTGAHDADATLTRQDYPNGLVATTTLDNSGQPTRLTYAKDSVDWMTFTHTYTPTGQVAQAASPGSSQAFGYDNLGRLEKVEDTAAGTCTTRVYGFDVNSNRTSLATHPADTAGDCTTASTPATEAHAYDGADRVTDPGYVYDPLGRTTTVPASAVSGGADLTVGYHANDMVATLTQNGRTQTFTLDPANRIRTLTDTAGPTITNHYGGETDSPAWIGQGTGWTRNVIGIDGGLAALQHGDGTTELQLANLHGDIIATADDTPTATAITAYFEHTEYGQARPGDPGDPLRSGTRRYEWLGKYQRSNDDLGGLALMGARLCNPITGRFLSVDPILGGNDNSYVYPLNPISQYDLTGEWCVWGIGTTCTRYVVNRYGHKVPVRKWAREKIRNKHNITWDTLRYLIRVAHHYERHGQRRVYRHHMREYECSSSGCWRTGRHIWMRLVVEWAKSYFDGKIVGVISAYCEGRGVCPNWVNSSHPIV